jgi:hypothetical protein
VISILKNTLTDNSDVLSPIFDSSISSIAHHMCQYDIISSADGNSPTYDGIINSFNNALPTKKTQSKLEAYCNKFLKALANVGGNAKDAADMLMEEWTEKVKKTLSINLNLSLD